MPIHIDHIIVPARDKVESMNWISHLLGVEPGPVVEPFAVVELGEANLDYMTVPEANLRYHHVALRVDEDHFEDILARVIDAGIDHFGHPQDPQDPAKGEIYYSNGGRGFYFWDPNGHAMEIKTSRDSFDPEVQANDYTAPYVPAVPAGHR
ncbi:VOC family protein [Haloechinothrix sp. LS1_15]|uniref:VOC family protein n=1 Tax=Haloechinothrix sp. LS1_15 TaxID=2652248 RepID=UPI0029478B4D|nr:VOC family protein [Haloechinothrix sp. LS1_15]MDV6011315.1 VOC family protein [Haloechinothrix sp. LS1_15]